MRTVKVSPENCKRELFTGSNVVTGSIFQDSNTKVTEQTNRRETLPSLAEDRKNIVDILKDSAFGARV